MSLIGAGLVLLPMFLLDKSSAFPGYNALLVCVGAGLIVAFPSSGKASVTRVLSNRVLVWIGLISYPLYLFHQPIISFLVFSNPDYPTMVALLIVFPVSILMSWMTYRYIELPVRNYVKRGPKIARRILTAGLVASIPFFAVSGLAVAKSGGVPERFKLLNPFAMEVAEAHGATFHRYYRRGFVVGESNNARVLFVGDSVLQQYAFPMMSALGIDRAQADFVTRGGCVLLKGVDFKDQFSDISCDDLRDRLYSLEKKYDLVVVSQQWEGYGGELINAPDGVSGIERWEPFLANTVLHFKKYADEVVVVGGHLKVTGATGVQPSVQISRESLSAQLRELQVESRETIVNAGVFFSKLSDQHSVRVINPYDIFCEGDACELTDGRWSYFSDSHHISSASSDFVTTKLKAILAANPVRPGI
ncbi:acyltransferase family protein [Marinobacter sp. DUT-1]|uniref:acyltransferase family protein n=1 Tax=Marinobacter sp. DUT-1 TaxID=3412037 RepID=UPI003D17C9FF